MRHPYTPVFRDFLTSSMWATDPATRCVWIWFLLMADPEGFVVGTVPGVAQQAGVTLEQAKTAIALLESPDPYSSTPDFEGRRIVKAERGWHIVNFVAHRERAKREAELARKRRWAEANRGKPKQLPLPFPEEPRPQLGVTVDEFFAALDEGARLRVDASSETLDAQKPKPKPPEVVVTNAREGFDTEELPVIPVRRAFHDLDGMDETGLEDEAVLAGMSREWFRERLKSARNLATIGGVKGVRDQREWVRLQFGNWKTWEETNRAKDAQPRAAEGAPRRFGSSPTPADPFEPDAAQEAFARRHGLPIEDLLKGVLADHPQPSATLSRLDVLSERLTVAAKQKRAGVAVTGKLTREQVAQWGPVPPGGAIPREVA
jgi:hypothetical protein